MAQAQEHPGVTLEVGCINGGPVTQVEQEEMAAILRDAKDDAAKSGVSMVTTLATMSYCQFLARDFHREEDAKPRTPVVVVSCPEKGSMDGQPPFVEKIMDTIADLEHITIAFDRAGTSNASEADKDAFAAATQIHESMPDNAMWKKMIKDTKWFDTCKTSSHVIPAGFCCCCVETLSWRNLLQTKAASRTLSRWRLNTILASCWKWSASLEGLSPRWSRMRCPTSCGARKRTRKSPAWR